MYELRYTSAAQKYFKKIKEKGLRKAFENGLTNIAENPYIGSAKVGDLASLYGYDVFYNKTTTKSPIAFMRRKDKSWLSFWPEPVKTFIRNSNAI